MAKRKLDEPAKISPNKRIATSDPSAPVFPALQIITGSYERVLHGITAWLPSEDRNETTFTDAFLYQPHTSRITSLALSPPSEAKKRVLATGSADERINLYQISTTAPGRPKSTADGQIAASKYAVTLSSGNKELGSLLNHGAAVTKLWFAGRSKLLSAAEDNTVAVTRLRDMTTLSTIKAPLPKAQNRPSGDTATANDLPRGINSFAVHPSMKLMVSVGRGERCMRLWNLVTGKKAGVLSFDKSVLAQIGEGKFSKGEGLSVEWDPEGEEFVVAFEKGALVFGLDARPKAKILTQKTKIHRIKYLPRDDERTGDASGSRKNIIAISTEDGRVLFYTTDTSSINETESKAEEETSEADRAESALPECPMIAQLGGRHAGVTSRVKDFEILQSHSEEKKDLKWYLVGGSSDGKIRVWSFMLTDLEASPLNNGHANGTTEVADSEKATSNGTAEKLGSTTNQIGKLLGEYVTENRITCLTAFMLELSNESPAQEEEDIGGEVTDEDSSNDD